MDVLARRRAGSRMLEREGAVRVHLAPGMLTVVTAQEEQALTRERSPCARHCALYLLCYFILRTVL